jgi:hypothetical protein
MESNDKLIIKNSLHYIDVCLCDIESILDVDDMFKQLKV